jgi:hypothetical protein
MGYWLLKRQIKELSLLITLRDNLGCVLYRENNLILDSKAEEIKIDNILSKLDNKYDNFLGSIELEIFSAVDLVFPYPAFVVNYYNQFGSGVVHTTGRIYNDFEDYNDNNQEFVKESGFDIFHGKDAQPFFAFINGHIANSGEITVEFINHKNEMHCQKISLGDIAPLETKLIKFKEYFSGLDDFLDLHPGTVKILHTFDSFFPRFVVGNLSNSAHSLAITHSYYDNSDNIKDSAYWHNQNTDILYDSVIMIPLLMIGDWYTELKLYPIHSPSSCSIDIELYSKDGILQDKVLNYKIVNNSSKEYSVINFNDIVNDKSLDKRHIYSAKLIQNYDDKQKIPTRLSWGLNIGKHNSDIDFPTNISFTSNVPNIKVLDKKTAFKWFPLLNQGGSLGVVTNGSYVKDYTQIANIEVDIYRTKDSTSIKRFYQIPPHGRQDIVIDEQLSDFLSSNTGWVTVKSDNPFVKAWYFEFNDSGVMGGDHSF